jgi:hypothetical protein
MAKKKKSQAKSQPQATDDQDESRRYFLKRLPYITPVLLTFQMGDEADAAKNKNKNKNKTSPVPKGKVVPPPPS